MYALSRLSRAASYFKSLPLLFSISTLSLRSAVCVFAASFIQAEILLQGDGHTVLLGRFTWQPEGAQALVKLSVVAQAGAANIVPNLQTALSSYSGAEYAYYNGRAAIVSLLFRRRLRPAYALEVIAPASEKQIARSRHQRGVFVTETAETYRRVVAPYIEALDPASTSWIYKCLDLSKEKERVLYNDTNQVCPLGEPHILVVTVLTHSRTPALPHSPAFPHSRAGDWLPPQRRHEMEVASRLPRLRPCHVARPCVGQGPLLPRHLPPARHPQLA